jgi:hypothetical protein
MKFPTSVHADGWARHLDTTPSAGPTRHASRPGARVDALAPWAGEPAQPERVSALTAAPAPQQTRPTAWWMAVGAGAVALAGLALWDLRDLGHPGMAPVSPAVISGTVQPDPVLAAAAPSAEPAAEPVPAAVAAEPAAEGPTLRTATPRAEPVARAAPRTPALQLPPAAELPLEVPPTAAGPVAVASPVEAAAQPIAEDSGITAQVRSALAADATLAPLPIAVSTHEGVVRLEGQAPDATTREHAAVVAASAAGVRAVDNRLTLPPLAELSLSPARS